MLADLEALAREEERSLNGQVVYAIKQWLASREREASQPGLS
jgi:hypothetical protein